MARLRLISLWRRSSQLTAGLSTAARNRAMTNQPMKERTCQSKKSAPSTTAAVKRAMTTVRITWEGEIRTHTTSALGTEGFGSVGAVRGSVRGFACVSFRGLIPSSYFSPGGDLVSPAQLGQTAGA